MEISIIHNSDQIKPSDLNALREAALREEKAIVELSRRPVFNEVEIKRRKIVMRSIKRLITIKERGGQTYP